MRKQPQECDSPISDRCRRGASPGPNEQRYCSLTQQNRCREQYRCWSARCSPNQASAGPCTGPRSTRAPLATPKRAPPDFAAAPDRVHRHHCLWIGSEANVENSPPTAHADWKCRNGHLPWMGLNADDFLAAAQAAQSKHVAGRLKKHPHRWQSVRLPIAQCTQDSTTSSESQGRNCRPRCA